MLYIFYTKYAKYNDFKQKYQELNSQLRLYCIEDYIDEQLDFEKNDVVYLLLNDIVLINKFINNFGNQVKIINKNYYINNLSKLDIQKTLDRHKILVPKILNSESTFPFLLKSINHQEKNIIINSIDDLNNFFKNMNIEEFYKEEIINYNKEYKIYYAYGNIFNKNGKYYSIKDYFLCKKISKILKLDTMSIDILIKEKHKYIIDINPSPAFYESNIGLRAFIKKTIKN